MKLKTQLALLCTTLLAVPWSGCAFLRANEKALITLQQQNLEVAGSSIAHSLNNQTDLLYTSPERATAPINADSLYATKTDAPPMVDGYFDEWENVPAHRFGGAKRPFAVRASATGDRLFLALSIFDNSKHYNDRGLGQEASGDRIVLTTWHANRRQRYVIATAAPGKVTAQVMGRRLPEANPDSIRGMWTDVGSGYQLELTLPLATASERLGIYYIDVDEGGISTRGNLEPLTTSAPPWLVRGSAELQQWIRNYDEQPIRVTVFDRWGWPLAQSTAIDTDSATDNATLTGWLYEQLLDDPGAIALPLQSDQNQTPDASINAALRGNKQHSLITIDGDLRSRFATPILSEQGVIGALLVEQPRARYLSATASAFEGLLMTSSIALALVVLTLLGFAIFLSYRIGRLRQEITGDAEHVPSALTRTPLKDELDELAQEFEQRLMAQRQLHSYLKALPQTLTHEIRTPVAIIRATLETLQDETITPLQHRELLNRAGSGLNRLSHIIDVMNESTRLEASIGDEPKSAIDLTQLLSELCSAYAQTYPNWRFDIDNPYAQAVATAAPDLIVQAMEKLIANATSFSKTGSTITLHLVQRGIWWRLSVSNKGPLIPADTQDLFAPLTSLRKSVGPEHHHLGLGLYIVALIAKHHGGEPYARNLPTEDGVDIGFTVQG